MDSIPKNSLLQFNPDTLEYVRKKCNLHQPGRMQEAIKILDEWTKKQAHFKNKKFDPHYLETTIIACKGSMERSKAQIDSICTFRTLMPTFFRRLNVKHDLGNLYDIVRPVILPKMTPDHHRVFMVKLNGAAFEASQFMDYYNFCIIIAEYLKVHDYLNGFLVFTDFNEINLMDFVTKLNPIELRQALTIYMQGFGMRLKGIHILSSSKLIDVLITILKQILSEKLIKRICVHKTMDTVYEHIPKNILPSEFGGEGGSVKEIHESWVELLSTDEHLAYLDGQRETRTDEALRQSQVFNEQYAGMPGTFRTLTVD
ncbi:PREDICTED: retinaldehyde-binding protein 1-like [Papilio xuthus]|uniref:Retinaldehyde-binding protein 1-like n=1 Tax=Papilio xuthus TaxID=66420 RepID=A0AAJ7E8Z9_PAPXU|nr:PREDICTED: retinaldehyde-binding protein 1-like [Papilio xuthus]